MKVILSLFLCFIPPLVSGGDLPTDGEEIILDDEWKTACYCFENMPEPPECCKDIVVKEDEEE